MQQQKLAEILSDFPERSLLLIGKYGWVWGTYDISRLDAVRSF